MKNLIFFTLFFAISFNVYSQSEKSLTFSDYRMHLFINGGIIYHTNKTESLNGKIRGMSTFDIAPSIQFFRFFKNKPVAISIGLNYHSFTNKFQTISGQYNNDYDSESKSIVSGSFYYKISLNYNYFLRLSEKLKLGGYIGPSYQVQKNTGLYNSYSWFAITSENNVILYTTESKFEAYKIRKHTISSQFGILLNYLVFKKNVISLNVGYTVGFSDFNRTEVILLLNNNITDRGTISSRGSGFNASIGISCPINL